MTEKDKKQIIITGGLVAVLAVVAIIQLKPAPRKPSVPAAESQAGSADASVLPRPELQKPEPTVSIEVRAKQEEIAQMDWGIDPFHHPVKTEEYVGAQWTLKGISIGPDKKGFAFINDDLFGVGDYVAGYKVEEVHKNKVLLRKGAESFYLLLPEK